MADFYRERNFNELHLKVIALKIQDGRRRGESLCLCAPRGGEDPSSISGYCTTVRAGAVKSVAEHKSGSTHTATQSSVLADGL